MDLYIDQIHDIRYTTLFTTNANSKQFSVKWSSNTGVVGEVLCIDTISNNDACNIIYLFA